MSDPYNVSTDGAYAVLFSVLGVFTILAILSAGYGAAFLPVSVQNLLVAHKQSADGKDGVTQESVTVANTGSGVLATDFFL